MTSIFRPPTARSEEINIAIGAMACQLGLGNTTYVAVPITGGPRFVTWYAKHAAPLKHDASKYSQALLDNVIQPNSNDAKRHISELVRRESCSVIDPSRLVVSGWSQDDYRHFWSRVIEQFATRAVFLDGWNLSSGCVYEFFVVTTLGLPAFDAGLERLSPGDGLMLIEQGISELRAIGADCSFMETIVTELAARESVNDGAI